MNPDLAGRPVGAGTGTETDGTDGSGGVVSVDDESSSTGADSGEPDEPPSRPQVLTSDEREVDDTVVDLDDLAGLLADVLDREGIPAYAEASLTLVDPEPIAELKAEHLDGDGTPTDVLSFPIDGADGVAGSWMVGDIVVSPTVALAQAPDHAGTLADELALLVVHGGLHLVGWDHEQDDDRRAMWTRERELLSEFGRAPTRDPWTDDAAATTHTEPHGTHAGPHGSA